MGVLLAEWKILLVHHFIGGLDQVQLVVGKLQDLVFESFRIDAALQGLLLHLQLQLFGFLILAFDQHADLVIRDSDGSLFSDVVDNEVIEVGDVFEVSLQRGWQVGVGNDHDDTFLFTLLTLEQLIDVLRCFTSDLLDDLDRDGMLSQPQQHFVSLVLMCEHVALLLASSLGLAVNLLDGLRFDHNMPSTLTCISLYSRQLLFKMGAVCCPPALEPPTPGHAKARKILMTLALAIIPIAILALVVGDPFQFFICLLLVFFLFIAWRMFNWCTVLMFFVYCIQQIIQNTIIIAGYIEYNRFFHNKYVPASIYYVVAQIYFIFAIFVSHYVYRVFKSHSNADGVIFDNNQPPQAPQGQGQAPYRALQEENRQNQPAYFQGEGVRIN